MALIRIFFRQHIAWAALFIALALAVKALVPAGYMPGQGERVLTLSICADASGGEVLRQVTIPMQPGHAGQDGTAKSQTPCAFSALGMAVMGGAGDVLLAAAIAFILALGFLPAPIPVLRRAHHLRPPLRGPPLLS